MLNHDKIIDSFDNSSPLSRDDFEQALNTINTTDELWRIIDIYVNPVGNHLNLDEFKDWLIDWIELNYTQSRITQLLWIRVSEGIQELIHALTDAEINFTDDERKNLIIKGIQLLNVIKHQNSLDVSGKYLLLEAAVLTPRIILEPANTIACNRYYNLSKKIHIEHPGWQILCGLMTALVSLISGSKKCFDAGVASIKAAWHAKTRSIIQQDMSDLRENIEHYYQPR